MPKRRRGKSTVPKPLVRRVTRRSRAVTRRIRWGWRASEAMVFLSRRWMLLFGLGITCITLAAAVSACRGSGRGQQDVKPRPGFKLGEPDGRSANLEPPTSHRLIRVLLINEEDSLPVSIQCPYTVLAENRRMLYRSPTALSGPIYAGQEGILADGRVYSGQSGLWFLPQYDGTLIINNKRYRGALHVVRQPTSGQLSAFNVVDIELYLLGLDEMPAKFATEAHKAQAIAARTYALYQKFVNGTGREWDVVATEGSQVYNGMQAEDPQRVQAVRQTAGVVTTWMSPAGEKLFPTYFSSNCGGITQDAGYVKPSREAVPLAGGVQSPLSATMPNATWGPVTLSEEEITRRLASRYPKIAALGRIVQLNVLSSTPEGRIAVLQVVDTNGKAETLRGEDFRLCMDTRKIKSTWCNITKKGRSFVFSDGKGFGHGMGLCQWGTEALARQGRSAEDILYFYYPGSRLAKAYDNVPGKEPTVEALAE